MGGEYVRCRATPNLPADVPPPPEHARRVPLTPAIEQRGLHARRACDLTNEHGTREVFTVEDIRILRARRAVVLAVMDTAAISWVEARAGGRDTTNAHVRWSGAERNYRKVERKIRRAEKRVGA